MIPSLRNTLTALLVAVLAGSAAAQSSAPGLKASHPSRYIVQKGDTLWDISGRFLNEPWRWPDVWQANPHIQNPHLIYPGDEVLLAYKDGRPIIRVRRRGVQRLSPRVRAEPLADGAIPTIPVDAIQQFLLRPRVVTEEEYDGSPYILSVGQEALVARPGGKVYVRGIESSDVTRYSVYRKGQPYVTPGAEGDEVLGFEAVHVADVVLQASGDPSTLVVTEMYREVLAGDRLVPVDEDQIYQNYMPRPVAEGVNGQIISVVDGVSQIGQFQTVVINLGARDGLEPGHVFAVYQSPGVVLDPIAKDPEMERYERQAREREERMPHDTGFAFVHGIGNAVEATSDTLGSVVREFEVAITGDKSWAEVTLPAERAGTVMIYRPFERLSYGLVMEAKRAMHVNDIVKNP